MSHRTGLPEIAVLTVRRHGAASQDCGRIPFDALMDVGISVRQCTSTRELFALVGMIARPIIVVDTGTETPEWTDTLSLVSLLRSSFTAGVMLVVGNSAAERIQGLNCGADVCLSAPVLGGELLAQVNALYRRIAPPDACDEGAVALNSEWQLQEAAERGSATGHAAAAPALTSAPSADVTVPWVLKRHVPRLMAPSGAQVDLTLTEHLMLLEVSRCDGQLLRHERWGALTGRSFGGPAAGKPSRALHVTVGRLRRKVMETTLLGLPLNARHGVGYQFRDPLTIEGESMPAPPAPRVSQPAGVYRVHSESGV